MFETYDIYIERTTREYIIQKGKDEALKFFDEMIQYLIDKINNLKYCDHDFIDDCQQGIYTWEERKICLLKIIE
jgi:hypothetical protein